MKLLFLFFFFRLCSFPPSLKLCRGQSRGTFLPVLPQLSTNVPQCCCSSWRRRVCSFCSLSVMFCPCCSRSSSFLAELCFLKVRSLFSSCLITGLASPVFVQLVSFLSGAIIAFGQFLLVFRLHAADGCSFVFCFSPSQSSFFKDPFLILVLQLSTCPTVIFCLSAGFSSVPSCWTFVPQMFSKSFYSGLVCLSCL